MRSKVFQEVLDETPKDVEIFIRLYTDLVLKINQILKKKGYTQAKLAEKLDKKPSEIHKWLNGEHNFTLRSIAKLQAELGEVLLEVPEKKTARKSQGSWRVSRRKEKKESWKYAAPAIESENVG